MTDKSNEQQNKPDSEHRIERVNELYEVADQIYGCFSEAEGPKIHKSMPPQNHVPGLGGDATETPNPTVEEVGHVWIVHALADIAEYAKKEKLDLVCASVTETQLRVAEMLGVKALSENAQDPLSSQGDSS